MSTTFLWIVIGCAIVTWIPRIVPFILVKKVELPEVIMKWLSYIPICILTALIVEHVWIVDGTGISAISIDLPFIYALLPTVIVAIWSRSLSLTVLIGVIAMALVRYFS
ncbi:MAG: AzlD domain-containing protein [Candidatus Pristimantibacillus lignocellulolyticus]|uniref:AzlD domain-containing protein n=1 Tax=Candidatus Pristimantibacillus lignocellulolyticus TaxID=2994561 RepID=A0A9J6ZL18_9BACL|nr:MAG: AzlD domain-containing protein [Candidatus Pristimantibacillus lignocellulolyticus]